MAQFVDLRVFQWIAGSISDDDFDLVILASTLCAFLVQCSTLADSVAIGAEESRAKFS